MNTKKVEFIKIFTELIKLLNDMKLEIQFNLYHIHDTVSSGHILINKNSITIVHNNHNHDAGLNITNKSLIILFECFAEHAAYNMGIYIEQLPRDRRIYHTNTVTLDVLLPELEKFIHNYKATVLKNI